MSKNRILEQDIFRSGVESVRPSIFLIPQKSGGGVVFVVLRRPRRVHAGAIPFVYVPLTGLVSV